MARYWYPFYFRDYFLNETVAQLDPDEHGVLNAMLHQEANNLSLPLGFETIAKLIRFDAKVLSEIWAKGRLKKLWIEQEIDGEQRLVSNLFPKDRRATTSKVNGSRGGRPKSVSDKPKKPTLVSDRFAIQKPKSSSPRARAAVLCSDVLLDSAFNPEATTTAPAQESVLDGLAVRMAEARAKHLNLARPAAGMKSGVKAYRKAMDSTISAGYSESQIAQVVAYLEKLPAESWRYGMANLAGDYNHPFSRNFHQHLERAGGTVSVQHSNGSRLAPPPPVKWGVQSDSDFDLIKDRDLLVMRLKAADTTEQRDLLSDDLAAYDRGEPVYYRDFKTEGVSE